MPLQVGASCYATTADAGRAACSHFEPVTDVTGNILRSVTCVDSDPVTGALNLQIVMTDTSVPVTTTQSVSHVLSYPPCVQQDYIDALEVITGAALAVWVIWWAYKKIFSVVNWSRGDHV